MPEAVLQHEESSENGGKKYILNTFLHILLAILASGGRERTFTLCISLPSYANNMENHHCDRIYYIKLNMKARP